jgi:hypothetical protein
LEQEIGSIRANVETRETELTEVTKGRNLGDMNVDNMNVDSMNLEYETEAGFFKL